MKSSKWRRTNWTQTPRRGSPESGWSRPTGPWSRPWRCGRMVTGARSLADALGYRSQSSVPAAVGRVESSPELRRAAGRLRRAVKQRMEGRRVMSLLDFGAPTPVPPPVKSRSSGARAVSDGQASRSSETTTAPLGRRTSNGSIANLSHRRGRPGSRCADAESARKDQGYAKAGEVESLNCVERWGGELECGVKGF